MTITSFLRGLQFVTYVFATTVVLVFSFSAYRRTRQRGFAVWIASSTIGIVQMSSWYIHIHRPLTDERTFNLMYRGSYIVLNIVSAIGTVMIIRYVLSMPPNQQVQPTADGAVSSASRSEQGVGGD